MNVFLCLAGQAAAAVPCVGGMAEDLRGAGPGWALRASTSEAHLPNLPEKPWGTNTGQRGERGYPLALPFIGIYWPFVGDLRRNESSYLREMWKCLKHRIRCKGGEWNSEHCCFRRKLWEPSHGLGDVKWAGYTSSLLILPDRVEERLNLLCG